MRKIKEVFRLNYEQKLSNRRIAKACHIARPTVGDYLNRAEAAGISWPLPEGMTESQIENALFPPTVNPALAHRVIPDWAQIHQELRHKHVTLFWLWQAYRAAHPNSDQYRWWHWGTLI